MQDKSTKISSGKLDVLSPICKFGPTGLDAKLLSKIVNSCRHCEVPGNFELGSTPSLYLLSLIL